MKVDTSKNIHVDKLHSDSLSTGFVITIKNSVRLHKHQYHSESIYVIKGEGKMIIGEDSFEISEGDYFNIPKNTPHSLEVISDVPMKVISFQSPEFLGKDRIFLD